MNPLITNAAGGLLRRTLFRSQVWHSALVRAGLLGSITTVGSGTVPAAWPETTGLECTRRFLTERQAVAHIAREAAGGLRFRDLRHTYATWLVSDGVPVYGVASVLGHEQTSTTLDRYTGPRHGRGLGLIFRSADRAARIPSSASVAGRPASSGEQCPAVIDH